MCDGPTVRVGCLRPYIHSHYIDADRQVSDQWPLILKVTSRVNIFVLSLMSHFLGPGAGPHPGPAGIGQ